MGVRAATALVAILVAVVPASAARRPAMVTASQESPAPTITNLTQSARTWRTGNALVHITRAGRPPVGTTISFDMNVKAKALLGFTQRAHGRRVGGRCVRPTKANRSRRRCKRFIPKGRLTFRAHAGTNKVRFAGRITRTRKLKPGRYSLTLFATDASGQSSFPNTLRFRIAGG